MNESTGFDFKGQSIYVGLDVHKKSWTMSIFDESMHLKRLTMPPDTEKLSAYLKRMYPLARYHVAYEAGYSGYWIHDQLKRIGIDCIVVHPGDVPTTDAERRNKTDVRDSMKLGKELQKGNLQGIQVPTIFRREDRGLIRQRRNVLKMLTRTKNQIKSILAFHGTLIPGNYDKRFWSKSFLAWLKDVELTQLSGKETLSSLLRIYDFAWEQFVYLNTQIGQLSQSDRYKEDVDLLCSVPGIGKLGAMIWLTELGDMNSFPTFDALVSYIGLVPRERSSGETIRTGSLNRRGNSYLRTLLIEITWTAVRKDPALLSAYQQLTKRMTGQQAIIPIARKVLRRMRHVLLCTEPYEIGH
ncbi:MAG TPA: IS110 family transposase [Candidatus Marinimicrobia bacterium]|nr:IS110 family transposase [Candidatus Neomarinimicrobiota bacterium]